MNNDEIISERRRLLRFISLQLAKKGISHEVAADTCGWKPATVKRMLNGDFGPKIDQLIALAAVAGLKFEIRER